MSWTASARRAGGNVRLNLGTGYAARPEVVTIQANLSDEAVRSLIDQLETSLQPDGSKCRNCKHTVKRCADGDWDDCGGWVHEGITEDGIGRPCEGLHGCPPDSPALAGLDEFSAEYRRIQETLVATPAKVGA